MKKIITYLLLVVMCATILTGCTTNKEKNKEYNVILTSATIPPMVTLLDIMGNGATEKETYAWIGRQNTISSIENLKKAFKKITLDESWSTASNIPNAVISSMNEFITDKWFESKETAKFNVYVTDYGILSALYLLENNGITSKNYKIHMVEDGSSAYAEFLTNQGYASADGKANFDKNLAELTDKLNKIREGKFELPETAFVNYNLSYPATTLPNVDYYLQYPELLVSENAEITKMIENKELKLVSKKLTSLYEALSTEKQTTVKEIIVAGSTIEQIKKDDKEKVLMITGTSFSGEGDILTEENVSAAGKDGNFETVVRYLANKYKNYKIIYKGHPAWGILESEIEGSRFIQPNRYQKVNAGTESERSVTAEEARAFLDRRIAFLNELHIEVLPAQTPAEAIIWAAGDDLVLAGYDSSLYMNAKPGSMLAFFASDVNALSALNQRLYGEGGVFYSANIEYLTRDNCRLK